MFTDMVGYTALMQKDESKAKTQRDRFRNILRHSVDEHGGQILQFYGDGALLSFGSAIEATRCGIEIQRALREEPKIPVRIGIHVGDVVFEDEGIFGDGVNVASRIESVAAPGGVCVSEKVYDEIKNQPEMETKSLGRFELKNVIRPTEIFALVGEGLAVPGKVAGQIKEKKHGRWYLRVALLVALVIVSVYFLWRTPEQQAMPNSIAVLPFVNMSPDPENEYFSDGMTEEILNALSKVEGLRVASRTSAFVFKQDQTDIRTIGERLNVGAVLEGSVRKSGARLRITAQLINVADGFHLWSETYERNVEDVFAIQDEISRMIVNKLRVKLIGEPDRPLVKPTTENLEAYNLFLKGRYHWNKWTKEGLEKAIEHFTKAIEIDPGFAQAYSGLADSYTIFGTQDIVPPKEAFPKAEAAARKALQLDNKLAEAHTSMGLVKLFYDWDWSAAEREFKRATDLNPGYASAHHAYAVYLTAMGRFDEAIAEIKRAQELDPLSIPISAFVGWVYLHARQYDLAMEEYRKTLELDPNFPGPHFLMGENYLAQSMFEEAFTAIRKGLTLSGDSLSNMTLL